jgi:2-oxoglutarate ferredoxin oxidoreductase subunit alpha
MDMANTPPELESAKPVTELDSVTVRFAGDSGDGMQLAGMQLTNTSALAGNDVATFPDFPAEIRAPRGTLAGVSGFQVHFASKDIHTPGDRVDTLVAMNPAGLRENLSALEPHGVLIVDQDSFDAKGLKLAGYTANPLEDGSLAGYQLVRVPLTRLTREAVEEAGLGKKLSERCRNFFAMGLVYWLYDRSLEPTLRFIERRFAGNPQVAEADRRALRAGWSFGETTDLLRGHYHVPAARLEPGTYRNITGNQAAALGLVAAAHLSGKDLFYGTYPITPASDILHELSHYKRYGVRTFQAEDEIAAVSSAIGAAFGGAMGVTASAGPGIALKAEAMGLAVMLELPLLVFDVMRGGPSTGLPTKPEQTDLLQVLFGRSGEAPLPVLAAAGPSDCFDTVLEAWRMATRLMTPVVILSDAFIANSAEPWRVPKLDELDPIPLSHPGPLEDGQTFLPYARDELFARPWALPGTPGLMHRVGGLEKQDVTGNVSYDPDNHQHMTNVRARKVENAAQLIPPIAVDGPESGRLLVLSWGGTRGACAEAVAEVRGRGRGVAHAHLRHLNPFPANLGEILSRYERVLVPELNTGQLRMLVRARFLVDADGLNKVKGRPFSTTEIVERIEELL